MDLKDYNARLLVKLVALLFFNDVPMCHFVVGLAGTSSCPPARQQPSSACLERRTILSRMPFVLAGMATTVTATNSLNGIDHSSICRCSKCNTVNVAFIANAYERRDVGGADASPETKAMNLQAYETNNRLERDGLKLEVRETIWSV
jgi:hypothetical protein